MLGIVDAAYRCFDCSVYGQCHGSGQTQRHFEATCDNLTVPGIYESMADLFCKSHTRRPCRKVWQVNKYLPKALADWCGVLCTVLSEVGRRIGAGSSVEVGECVLLSLSVLLMWMAAAQAGDCPDNPDALGTERVVAVDPNEHPRIGTMQYPESLPLNDHEVVLTFDDAPVPLYTNRVLEALESECVKATFFIVGQQARAYPAEVRKIYNEGHTIATHSQTHPHLHAPTHQRRPTGDRAGHRIGNSRAR
jgi:hypothetical protein